MNIRYVIIEWRRLQVSTVKLKSEVIIEADRALVWRLFGDPDNLASWQPSLESVRLVSGTRGHPDAVSELIYDENGRKVVLTETITATREPDFVGGTYVITSYSIHYTKLYDVGHALGFAHQRDQQMPCREWDVSLVTRLIQCAL